MELVLNILSLLIGPAAMAILLVFAFGLVSRSGQSSKITRIFMGLTFGLAAAYATANQFELTSGFTLDLGSLFIAAAAAFFGWKAGLVALSIGVVDLLLLGGDGSGHEAPTILVAATVGLAWNLAVQAEQKHKIWSLALLGTMLNPKILMAFLIPIDLQIGTLIVAAVAFTAVNVAGVVLIGRLLHREMKLIDQANALEHAAKTDPLTNLPNRRTLHDKMSSLPKEFEGPNGRAVIYLDIDHFKDVNDTHGHLVGDLVLTQVVAKIRKCLRPDDLFARIGGDEFAVVLPDINEIDARRAAERFCSSVAASPLGIGDKKISVTVSMGVFWTDKPIGFEGLLMSADAQLYNSKSKGRNRVSFKTGVAQTLPANIDPRDLHPKRSAAAL